MVVAEVDLSRAQRLCEELGPNSTAVPLDVRDAEAFQRVVEETAAKYGSLDFLFNNAGIMGVGEIRDLSLSSWRALFETNFFGVVHGTTAAYKVMVKQQSGHIVNLASQAGLLPSPLYAPYASSKAAVIALSNALRLEAKDFGIKIAVVCPGNVATNIFDASERANVERRDVFKTTPLSMLTPAKAAEEILRGVERNRYLIAFPLSTRLMWLAYRLVPNAFDPLLSEVVRRFRRARVRE